jgi:uncharacterized protein involved in exopolysaccharide biosynthesis
MMSAPEIGAILWRGRWSLGVTILVGIVCGVLLARMQAPEYVAEALVIVRPPIIPTLDLAHAETPAAWLTATTRDVMTSRSIVERAIVNADLSPPPPAPGIVDSLRGAIPGLAGESAEQGLPPADLESASRDAAELEAVQSGLDVAYDAGSFAIVVRQTSPSPAFSASFANALVNAYIHKQVEDIAARKAERLDALVARRDDIAQQIEHLVQEALLMSRRPNTQIALDLKRERLAELQQVENALATRIERLQALAADPNIWFVSPAVVPVKPSPMPAIITLTTSSILSSLFIGTLLIIREQLISAAQRRSS